MGKDDISSALDWLEEGMGEASAKEEPSGEEDSDWLGISQVIKVDESELRERYKVEATLRKLTNQIHSLSLDEILLDLGRELQDLFSCERVTVYAVDRVKKEIFSKVKDGEEAVEIRVPIGFQSLAGFVADSGRVLAIADAYDDAEIKSINSHLSFDISWDQKSGFRTRQVLAVPIKAGRQIEGVIQLVNRRGSDGPFTGRHKRALMEIAETLSIAFANQRQIRVRRSRFDRLFAMCLINEEMIDEANQLSQTEGGSQEFYLSTKFSVPKKEILASLSEFYRKRPIEFAGDAESPPREILEQFTVDYLKHHGCCPISIEDDNWVTLATVNPKDVVLIDDVGRRLDRSVKVRVAIREDVEEFVEHFYGSLEAPAVEAPPVEALSAIINTMDFDDTSADVAQQEEDVEVQENSSGLVRLVNQIIEHAYHRGTSDIHIEPYPDHDLVIRFRIDGVCQTYTTVPRRFARAMLARLKIMSGLDIAERRLPQDGKIKFKKFSNLDIELRVATLPTVGGLEDCVMRILAASKPMPLDQMGFMSQNLERFKNAVAQPYGLVLVVGPTGSGKTTTLHSALGFINKPETKIWTAEDPVEITQRGLRQLQIHKKIGLDFERAMRAFLRADPDVIMIGEMRDRETAEAGIEASLTGHLVFSTLHTNSAPETITRLLDMEIDPFSFGDSLLGVLAQRLCRRLCKECKRPLTPSADDLAALKLEFDNDAAWDRLEVTKDLEMFERVGCAKCNKFGYKGRMGIHEFMPASEAIRTVVYRRGKVSELRDLALEEGMTTLKQDGTRKVFMGLTDMHEIRRVCIK